MLQLNKISIWLPLLLACVTALGMKAGYTIYQNRANFQNSNSSAAFANTNGNGRLEELMQLVDAFYVDTVSVDNMSDKALSDFLQQLDPHSAYIAKSEIEMINSELSGSFDGIGVEFSIVNDTINVITALGGGPSEELGITAGDKIIKINDTLVAGIGIKNSGVTKRLRGPKGTVVNISIKRAGSKNLIQYDITRAPIPVTSVDASYMITPEVGYIKINKFSATTYDEFITAVTQLEKKGYKKLVLDLRDNPGGYLQAATLIADEFLSDNKMIVYTKGRKFPKKEYKAKRNGRCENIEIVVLMDTGSASASEIVSGAIQDWDRGTIVGRRSFGKGLVQEQFDLADGSACRITIAKYYTPTGRCIQRNFKPGEIEDYYKDLNDRVDNGELSHADSMKITDTVRYLTPKGKVLYGGGGITPDVFVPIDTMRYSTDFYLARIQIPAFVYQYYNTKLEGIKSSYTIEKYVENFSINDADYQAFLTYANNKSKALKIEKLAVHKADIQLQIKATIARQLWRDGGFYQVINTKDEDVQKAITVFK